MKYIGIILLLSTISCPLWSQSPPRVYEELEKRYNQNAFDACIRMEQQVEDFADHRLDTLVANSFFYMGDAYYQQGEIEKALAFFEREKKTLEALGLADTENYSHSLSNLTYLYLEAGNYALAATTAATLLVTDRKLYSTTDDTFVQSVLDVSDIYIQLDRFGDAESVLLNTLRAQERKSINRGQLLNKLGDLYSYTGQYSRASKSLLEALDIHAEHGGEESAGYINAAINLGILYMNQGKYPEAEEIFDVALTKVDASEAAYPALLNNQALVFQSLGQLDRAASTFHEIQEIDSLAVGTSHPDYAITLSNLGLVYADQKHFTDAERTLTTALAIQKNNGDEHTLSFARKLNNLAKIFQLAGTPERSVPLLRNALSIFQKTVGRKSPEYATGTYNLGLAYWAAGKGKTGYKYLKSSAAIRAKILGKNHPLYAESVLKIGEYQWHQKSVKDARRSFGEVFENYYFQIDETFPVLTEEEKSKFYFNKMRDAFNKFNSFALSHSEHHPELIGDAYNYLINTKAVIMLATEKVKASIMSSGDTALISQFERWQAGKEQIAKLYTLNQQNRELDSLFLVSSRLEKELARRSSAFKDQFVRQKNTWREIQKTLKEGEAAVEVLRFKSYRPEGGGNFTEDIRYAFLVVTPQTANHPALVRIKDGNDLESKYLRYYRNNIQYKLRDVYSYEHYFKSLAEYLKGENIRRVYFSPDGVYNQINLNSIENPDSKRFLIDELDIRFVTNTRELLAKRSSEIGNAESAILLGYPQFNLEETEPERRKDKKHSTRGGSLQRTWRGGLLRYMRSEGGISMLPGTRVEVERIAVLFDGASTVYTESDASERAVKNVQNPQVLHIATHGYFLEDQQVGEENTPAYVSNPLLNAGLILAGAENFLTTGEPINSAGDDGILTAFEAMNMHLDQTQLVVLSACETALGDVKNGEGVYGLQRAFKLAGARNIVMSLWNVDDEATQKLMTSFYTEMLRTGDQHQAFRAAQQEVKKEYPSPFYWGAFIMMGI